MVTRCELLFSKGERVSGCFAVLHLNLVIRVIGDDDNDEKFAFQIQIRDELDYHFWLCVCRSVCHTTNHVCGAKQSVRIDQSWPSDDDGDGIFTFTLFVW